MKADNLFNDLKALCKQASEATTLEGQLELVRQAAFVQAELFTFLVSDNKTSPIEGAALAGLLSAGAAQAVNTAFVATIDESSREAYYETAEAFCEHLNACLMSVMGEHQEEFQQLKAASELTETPPKGTVLN